MSSRNHEEIGYNLQSGLLTIVTLEKAHPEKGRVACERRGSTFILARSIWSQDLHLHLSANHHQSCTNHVFHDYRKDPATLDAQGYKGICCNNLVCKLELSTRTIMSNLRDLIVYIVPLKKELMLLQ